MGNEVDMLGYAEEWELLPLQSWKHSVGSRKLSGGTHQCGYGLLMDAMVILLSPESRRSPADAGKAAFL